jgi:hypothetical protein
LLLTIVLTPVGLFGGALVGFGVFLAHVVPTGFGQAAGAAGTVVRGLLGVVCFLGGGILGGWLVESLTRRVAARCPACGGRAYYHDGKPITYRCGACGHVHATIWSTRGRWSARGSGWRRN